MLPKTLELYNFLDGFPSDVAEHFKRKWATLGIGRKRARKTDYDVATGVEYQVGSFASWSKSIMYPQNGYYERIREPLNTTASFQG